jgi:hypothetical protein
MMCVVGRGRRVLYAACRSTDIWRCLLWGLRLRWYILVLLDGGLGGILLVGT